MTDDPIPKSPRSECGGSDAPSTLTMGKTADSLEKATFKKNPPPGSPPEAPDFFPSGSYDTPIGTRRSLLDRILLGSGIYFHLVTWRIVIGGSFRASTGAYSPWHWQKDSLRFLRGVEACGAKVHVRGLENVRDPERPVVFIANHMSALETWLICCLLLSKKRMVTFVVKESLLRFPFFKHFLWLARRSP